MAKTTPLPAVPVHCPVCGRTPDVDECGPWPASEGPPPWHAGCFGYVPHEHYVGVNGDDRADAIRAWNAEVAKIKRGDFESPATVFPQ